MWLLHWKGHGFQRICCKKNIKKRARIAMFLVLNFNVKKIREAAAESSLKHYFIQSLFQPLFETRRIFDVDSCHFSAISIQNFSIHFQLFLMGVNPWWQGCFTPAFKKCRVIIRGRTKPNFKNIRCRIKEIQQGPSI